MKLMGIDVDIDKVFRNQLALSLGLDDYKKIMGEKLVEEEFQKTFNKYYQVRRNKKWRQSFYKIFKDAREKHYSFKEIIEELYKQTNRVEASFSSKMLATIDASKPVLDHRVLQFLNLKLRGTPSSKILKNAIALYSELEEKFEKYLKTPEAKDAIEIFDNWFPSYSWISSVKKIDCLLWVNGGD